MASILEQEIREQPEIMRRMIDQESKKVKSISDKLRGRFDYIMIAARGTSDNAARYAKYTLGSFNHFPIALATPSLFTLYNRPPQFKRSLIIGISQSGQSLDIGAVLNEARRQGQATLAITNFPDSPMGANADYVIELHCDIEHAICATKTYTSSLIAIALFSAFLADDQARFNQVKKIPDWMAQTILDCEPSLDRAERYRYLEHCAVIGRGFNYATAFECALKIQELTGIVAEPYSSADFRHGPIAMIDKGDPIIAIAPSGKVRDDLAKLINEVRARGGEFIIISDDSSLLKQGKLGMQIPADMPEWLTPMVAIIPAQIFALRLAEAMGVDVDKPHGLSKVTETW